MEIMSGSLAQKYFGRKDCRELPASSDDASASTDTHNTHSSVCTSVSSPLTRFYFHTAARRPPGPSVKHRMSR